LAALLDHEGRSRARLAVPLLAALFGAGLLFGDGVITPAISILGAMEGLSEQNSDLTHLVVPITIAILVVLFAVQRFGTGSDRRRLRLGHAGVVRRDRRRSARWIAGEARGAAAIDPATPCASSPATARTGSCCSARWSWW
jgi:hypothetical protein